MSEVAGNRIFEDYDPESATATALRRLYHNIQGKRPGGGSHRSFLITSSSRGEGKSTISSYLALTIAQFPKQKVLLVDADLRRPRAHKIFGLSNTVGLRDCLEFGADPADVVQDTALDNLKVIPSGGCIEAPSRLFEAELLQDFFEKVHFYYDIVLVDSPPVLAVSDTLFLCNQVEAVLFVILAGVTSSGVVQRAKEVLEDSGANALGVVVNNALDVLPSYYGYKYYGYEND